MIRIVQYCRILLLALLPLSLPSQPAHAQGDPPAPVVYNWPKFERQDSKKQPVVEAIQYLLRAQGHSLLVDGTFGNQTAWHVKQFQRKHNLKNTGVVDDATWEALIIPVKRGSRGNAVRAVQSRLRGHGYNVVLDGWYGPHTQKAVGKFQSSKGNLIVDGVVGRNTWCFLVNGSFAP